MTPDSVTTNSRNDGDFNVSQVWLDALSGGTCDEEAFLRAVQMLTRRSPEAAWESLALLDQYYRRGKIASDVFKRVKSRLGSQLLGPALDVEISVPVRRQESAPAPAVVVPVPTPPTPPTAAAPASVAPITSAVPPGAPAVAPAPPLLTTPAAPRPVASRPAPALAEPSRTARARPAAVPNADAAPRPAVLVPPTRGAERVDTEESVSSGATVPIGVGSTSRAAGSSVDRSNELEPSNPREVVVGDVLRERYVIKSVLGLGGTGTVFEAIDRYRLDLPESGQRVAVKVLHAAAAGRSAVLVDLRREFQLLQSLSHPNIVRAHEYDRDGDTAFFTMEYLSGLSIESVLSAHRDVVLGRAHVLMIVRDVAAALEHAHSRGVVHGDLNPGNIFITNDGEIRVLDFGAAHTPIESPETTEAAWDATAYATPRYASAQLLNGERVDVRDDTYSLACVLYVLLAGRHPFGALNAVEARSQRLKPPRPPGLSGKQWRALRAALSFERQRRPADIAGWLAPFALPGPEARLPPLPALLQPTPRRARRGGAAALIAAGLALAAAVWWANGHRDLVSQIAADAGVDLKDAVASADAALNRLWHSGQSAIPASPAPEPPARPPAAPISELPGGATAQTGQSLPTVPTAAIPQTAATQARRDRRSVEASSPPVPADTPAARIVSGRTAVAATASSAIAVPLRPAASALPSHARIELAADEVDVPATDPAAHVLVKRTGNLHADVSFTWWTESGTAKPGQDFMMVKEHTERFEDGKAVANLFVPVVGNPTRKQPRSFYIVIDEPSDGASLGKRTLTMVTITPPE